MKLLIDMNLLPRWVDALRAAGHEAVHWSTTCCSNNCNPNSAWPTTAGAYTFAMRLTSIERATIRDTVQAVAGGGSRVRLFGSRVDDLSRGGDIDLLVELDHAVAQPTLFSARIGARLQQALGDRRIDILLAAPNLREEPIHRVARETGIEL